MTVLTLIYVPGLLLFLRASRDARLQEVTLLDPHGLAAAAPRARPPGARGRLVAAGDHRRGVGRRPRRQRLAAIGRHRSDRARGDPSPCDRPRRDRRRSRCTRRGRHRRPVGQPDDESVTIAPDGSAVIVTTRLLVSSIDRYHSTSIVRETRRIGQVTDHQHDAVVVDGHELGRVVDRFGTIVGESHGRRVRRLLDDRRLQAGVERAAAVRRHVDDRRLDVAVLVDLGRHLARRPVDQRGDRGRVLDRALRRLAVARTRRNDDRRDSERDRQECAAPERRRTARRHGRRTPRTRWRTDRSHLAKLPRAAPAPPARMPHRATHAPTSQRPRIWQAWPIESVRVDQWLWSVRLTKTRSDAAAACRGGHVKVNGKTAKPATPLKVGDRVEARLHDRERICEVTTLIAKRGRPTDRRDLLRRLQPATAGEGRLRPTVRSRSGHRSADEA